MSPLTEQGRVVQMGVHLAQSTPRRKTSNNSDDYIIHHGDKTNMNFCR